MSAELIIFPREPVRIVEQKYPVIVECTVVRVLSHLELIRRRWRKADDSRATEHLSTAALDDKVRQKLRAILHDSVGEVGRERALQALEAVRFDLAEGRLD